MTDDEVLAMQTRLAQLNVTVMDVFVANDMKADTPAVNAMLHAHTLANELWVALAEAHHEIVSIALSMVEPLSDQEYMQ